MENKLVPAVLVVALTLACAFAVIFGLRKALARTSWSADRQMRIHLKTMVAIVVWLMVVGALAYIGIFSDLTSIPPRPVFLFLVSFVAALALTYSKSFKEIMRVTPVQWFVYVQSFRILVELILWQGYLRGLLPVQMTFEGYNFDVFSGLLALPAGFLMGRYPSVVQIVGVTYNLIGIVLLLNILTIAVLSMPTPYRYFTNEPSNTIVGEFPFIYIPGAFVVLAIFMHVFSLRQLYLMRRA